MEENNGRAERVLHQTRVLNEDMKGLASELGAAAKEIRAKVDLGPMVQQHPFRTLMIAAGVGYVVGGGLFTPLTGTMMRIGTRALLLPLLRSQLTNMAESAMQREL